ncbi:MAG: hypothetical protein P4M14_03420 [Gammaproteobacteria bacterium]|nr:hypothetical protein [Gammaproteobacteria bacterium]
MLSHQAVKYSIEQTIPLSNQKTFANKVVCSEDEFIFSQDKEIHLFSVNANAVVKTKLLENRIANIKKISATQIAVSVKETKEIKIFVLDSKTLEFQFGPFDASTHHVDVLPSSEIFLLNYKDDLKNFGDENFLDHEIQAGSVIKLGDGRIAFISKPCEKVKKHTTEQTVNPKPVKQVEKKDSSSCGESSDDDDVDFDVPYLTSSEPIKIRISVWQHGGHAFNNIFSVDLNENIKFLYSLPDGSLLSFSYTGMHRWDIGKKECIGFLKLPVTDTIAEDIFTQAELLDKDTLILYKKPKFDDWHHELTNRILLLNFTGLFYSNLQTESFTYLQVLPENHVALSIGGDSAKYLYGRPEAYEITIKSDYKLAYVPSLLHELDESTNMIDVLVDMVGDYVALDFDVTLTIADKIVYEAKVLQQATMPFTGLPRFINDGHQITEIRTFGRSQKYDVDWKQFSVSRNDNLSLRHIHEIDYKTVQVAKNRWIHYHFGLQLINSNNKVYRKLDLEDAQQPLPCIGFSVRLTPCNGRFVIGYGYSKIISILDLQTLSCSLLELPLRASSVVAFKDGSFGAIGSESVPSNRFDAREKSTLFKFSIFVAGKKTYAEIMKEYSDKLTAKSEDEVPSRLSAK